jgi:hypothetical protein
MSNPYDSYNSVFNSLRYKNAELARGQEVNYVDGSDAYANLHKMVISFQHVPTGKSVFFKAFITAFNETYSTNWASEEVYGRPDPLYLFKGTARQVTLAFKIPAATESESYENLGKVSSLAQFLYPAYTNPQYAQTITQSPLVRIKVMNLLKTTVDEVGPRLPGQVQTSQDMYDQYVSSPASAGGLLGAITSFVINHNIDREGVMEKATNTVLPKLIDVNLGFSPVHEHAMGWDELRRFGAPTNASIGQGSNTFPYGVILNEPAESLRTAVEGGTKAAVNEIIADQKKTDGRYLQALEDEARARYLGVLGGEFGDASRMNTDYEAGGERKETLDRIFKTGGETEGLG